MSGHAPNAAPSSAHWNVEPASVELKVKVALVLLTEPVGPVLIVVSGAVVSITNVCDAGVGSMLPPESIARTWNVWLPGASDAVVCGELQGANVAVSTRHWNVAPGSSAMKLNVGVVSLPGLPGPAVIAVSATWSNS